MADATAAAAAGEAAPADAAAVDTSTGSPAYAELVALLHAATAEKQHLMEQLDSEKERRSQSNSKLFKSSETIRGLEAKVAGLEQALGSMREQLTAKSEESHMLQLLIEEREEHLRGLLYLRECRNGDIEDMELQLDEAKRLIERKDRDIEVFTADLAQAADMLLQLVTEKMVLIEKCNQVTAESRPDGDVPDQIIELQDALSALEYDYSQSQLALLEARTEASSARESFRKLLAERSAARVQPWSPGSFQSSDNSPDAPSDQQFVAQLVATQQAVDDAVQTLLLAAPNQVSLTDLHDACSRFRDNYAQTCRVLSAAAAAGFASAEDENEDETRSDGAGGRRHRDEDRDDDDDDDDDEDDDEDSDGARDHTQAELYDTMPSDLSCALCVANSSVLKAELTCEKKLNDVLCARLALALDSLAIFEEADANRQSEDHSVELADLKQQCEDLLQANENLQAQLQASEALQAQLQEREAAGCAKCAEREQAAELRSALEMDGNSESSPNLPVAGPTSPGARSVRSTRSFHLPSDSRQQLARARQLLDQVADAWAHLSEAQSLLQDVSVVDTAAVPIGSPRSVAQQAGTPPVAPSPRTVATPSISAEQLAAAEAARLELEAISRILVAWESVMPADSSPADRVQRLVTMLEQANQAASAASDKAAASARDVVDLNQRIVAMQASITEKDANMETLIEQLQQLATEGASTASTLSAQRQELAAATLQTRTMHNYLSDLYQLLELPSDVPAATTDAGKVSAISNALAAIRTGENPSQQLQIQVARNRELSDEVTRVRATLASYETQLTAMRQQLKEAVLEAWEHNEQLQHANERYRAALAERDRKVAALEADARTRHAKVLELQARLDDFRPSISSNTSAGPESGSATPSDATPDTRKSQLAAWHAQQGRSKASPSLIPSVKKSVGRSATPTVTPHRTSSANGAAAQK